MELQMKMPDLATTGSDIRILRWLINPGQSVRRGEPLLEIETEKAISQVESIATGVLKQIRALPNNSVSVGQVIATFDTADPPTRVAAPSLPSSSLSSSEGAVALTRYKRTFLLALYERMVLIREFEERVKLLFFEGAMPGTIHQCQ